MKRQLLGKIIVLLLFPLMLLAGVKATVDSNVVYKGDSITYTISATGGDIEFPSIHEIGGNTIISTASSKNIRIVNGDFQKTISQSYTFSAADDVEIPSYTVLIDGHSEKTKALSVKVVEPTQDKNAPVVLETKLSKKSVHVGEVVRFDLTFKKKPNVPIYKLEIEDPKFEDFWVKKLDGVKEGVDGAYSTQTYSYLLFAQRSGRLKIPAVAANVGQLQQQRRRGMDPFFNAAFGQQVRNTKIYSNPLEINVTALPNNLELYGHFNISAQVDKKEVLVNKPLNLTLKVEGVGNIDDVQKFTLDIPGAVIYANEPTIKSHIDGGEYGGSFEQKIVIIADHSYTIPAMQLHYFDAKTQKEVRVSTAPIAIDVKGGAATTVQTAQNSGGTLESAVASTPKEKPLPKVDEPTNYLELIIVLLTGFGIGVLFSWLVMKNSNEKHPKRKVELPITLKIKKSQNDKKLFELLLPYKNEGKVVDEALMQLEENLYKGSSHEVDKKALIAYFSGSDDEVELI